MCKNKKCQDGKYITLAILSSYNKKILKFNGSNKTELYFFLREKSAWWRSSFPTDLVTIRFLGYCSSPHWIWLDLV